MGPRSEYQHPFTIGIGYRRTGLHEGAANDALHDLNSFSGDSNIKNQGNLT